MKIKNIKFFYSKYNISVLMNVLLEHFLRKIKAVFNKIYVLFVVLIVLNAQEIPITVLNAKTV
jgi:hypothetical protein